MPQVNGRSPGQVARFRAMAGSHRDTAAELERAGKFELARIHLTRANLFMPTATFPDG